MRYQDLLQAEVTRVASPSDAQAFLSQCGVGRLLSVAVEPSGTPIAGSPALLELLGGELEPTKLSALLEGKGPDEVVPASVLVLQSGVRIVGFREPPERRRARVLDGFAKANRLTQAERAALDDIAAGSSAKESAARLSLSPETVRARRKRIFQKVGVGGCGEIQARLLDLV